MKLFPDKPGVYWATLSREGRVIEVSLFDVRSHKDPEDISGGAFAQFLDGSGRRLQLLHPEQEIVRPFAGSRHVIFEDECHITWLRRIDAEPGFPAIGDAMAA